MKKTVWFDGGSGKKLGEVETIEEARDLAWKFIPVKLKGTEWYRTKEDVSIKEFKHCFIAI